MVGKRYLAAAALAWGTACSSTQLGAPIAQFPSRTELDAVAQQPAAPVPPFSVVAVDRWQDEAERAVPGSTYPRASAWDEQLLAALGAKPGLEPSSELRCAALEAARFYCENGAFPDGGLRAFLLARCGSTLPYGSLQTLTLQVEDARPEKDIAVSVAERVRQMIESLAPKGSVGLGFARGKGRASVVVYHGTPLAAVEPSPLVTGKEFVVSGRLLGDAASATALVTMGRYGVAQCEPDRRLESPQFSFVCPMLEQDDHALVEIVTRRPERLLGQAVLRAMVLRSADAGKLYDGDFSELARPRRSASGEAATPPQPPSFADSLLTALNRIRHAAKLDPLALEGRQSQFNARLAPHFFQAAFADDGAGSDLIALGVLAGWDVDGTIRNGGVYAGGEETMDGARWLGMALEAPSARYTLLNPDMSKIAIGTLQLQASGTMALVSTYDLFQSNDHSAEEAAIFEELAKQREARGLPAPLRRRAGKELTDALGQVVQGERSSEAGLQQALNDVATRTGLRMQGVIVEASDVSLVPVAPQLLAPGSLELAVGVAHYRPKGGAWGQYIIFYLFVVGPSEDGPRAATPGPAGAG